MDNIDQLNLKWKNVIFIRFHNKINLVTMQFIQFLSKLTLDNNDDLLHLFNMWVMLCDYNLMRCILYILLYHIFSASFVNFQQCSIKSMVLN